MKTIFRFLNVGMLLTAFIAAGAVTSFAQDACADADGQTALYTKFGDQLKAQKTPADRRATIETGKQFLEKYGACAGLEPQAKYLNDAIPKLEAAIKKEELKALFARYDKAVQGKTYADAYAAGKEILAVQPDNLDIIIPLGAIGLYESYNKNYVFNDDALRFARMAIDKMNANKPSTKYGVFQFQYNTKENALSEMTYAIGYINYHAKGDKKGALPMYYETTQLPGKNKDNPLVYETIGAYYFDEVKKLADEIKTKIAAQNTADTDEVKLQKENEIKAKIALMKGFAERSMDAYGRAYNKAAKDAPTKPYRDGLYKTLETLYGLRFEKKEGLDTWIASTTSKPMPNPTTEVTPVVEEPTTTTTTTTGATTSGLGSGVGKANGTGIGAANGTGVGAANGSGATATPGRTASAKPTTGKSATPASGTAAKVKPKK